MNLKDLLDFILKVLTIRSIYLFAIALALLIACLVLTILGYNYSIFKAGAENFCPVLLVLGLITFMIAVARYYAENNVKTVELVPIQSVVTVAKQPDGRELTQITCHFAIYNLTGEAIWLTQVKLTKPRSFATYVHRNVHVKQQEGPYSGSYAIPPRCKTDGSGHIMLDANLKDKIKNQGFVLKIADQHGYWHTIKITNPHIV